MGGLFLDKSLREMAVKGLNMSSEGFAPEVGVGGGGVVGETVAKVVELHVALTHQLYDFQQVVSFVCTSCSLFAKAS